MFVTRQKAAILTVEQMYQADRLAIEGGIPGWSLMQAAGAAVTREAVALTRRGQHVTVLCGPGNNGGDGFVAAAYLRQAGRRVTVRLLGAEQDLRDDAASALTLWHRQGGGTVLPLAGDAVGDADLVVDALFGAGLNRAPEGVAAQAITRIAALGIPVVAVDVPSGVDGHSGRVLGQALQAAVTVCFFRAKPGHYLYPGKAHRGRLVVADIGIPDTVLPAIGPSLFVNGPALWRIPLPSWRDHKYSRGHVMVIGSAEMSGAARLVIRGARRVGAGLVTAAVPRSAVTLYAANAPGVLITPRADDPAQAAVDLQALLADGRRSVVVIGPGLAASAQTQAAVQACLTPTIHARGRAVVLDAGALSAHQGQAEGLFAAIAQGHAGGLGPVVMTPHDGEFVRLFPDLPADDPTLSRLERACRAAQRSGAVVVLKGPDTVVAEPGGMAALAPCTVPDLATGGSGDVLAGLVAGLLGQGMPGFDAAACAVWLHGEAARRFGAGLIAEDISEQIPAVLATLRP